MSSVEFPSNYEAIFILDLFQVACSPLSWIKARSHVEACSSSLAKVDCFGLKLSLSALSPLGFVLVLCGEAVKMNTAPGTGTKRKAPTCTGSATCC